MLENLTRRVRQAAALNHAKLVAEARADYVRAGNIRAQGGGMMNEIAKLFLGASDKKEVLAAYDQLTDLRKRLEAAKAEQAAALAKVNGDVSKFGFVHFP
jgi:hypothetical protein